MGVQVWDGDAGERRGRGYGPASMDSYRRVRQSEIEMPDHHKVEIHSLPPVVALSGHRLVIRAPKNHAHPLPCQRQQADPMGIRSRSQILHSDATLLSLGHHVHIASAFLALLRGALSGRWRTD